MVVPAARPGALFMVVAAVRLAEANVLLVFVAAGRLAEVNALLVVVAATRFRHIVNDRTGCDFSA